MTPARGLFAALRPSDARPQGTGRSAAEETSVHAGVEAAVASASASDQEYKHEHTHGGFKLQ